MTPGARPMTIGRTRRHTRPSAARLTHSTQAFSTTSIRHERRVQNPVGQEQQRERDGDRREPVPERAVDDGGDEGDENELGRVGELHQDLLRSFAQGPPARATDSSDLTSCWPRATPRSDRERRLEAQRALRRKWMAER